MEQENYFYDESEKYARHFVKAYNDLIRSNMTNSELRLYLYFKTYGQTSGKIFPSFKTINKEIGFAPATTTKAIKGLMTKGYLKVEKEKTQRGLRNNYFLLDPYYSKLKDKTENSKEETKTQIPYKKIIDYLNEKTGKNYSHKTQSHRNFIQARFNEGHTLDDFKYVIDVKVYDWSDSAAMKTYLQPKTLFNSTNFDKYKNETFEDVKARKERMSGRNSKGRVTTVQEDESKWANIDLDKIL